MQHRPYVVSGNPGTGKSVSCLEFLQQGFESGETVVLLSHDDPADVKASAAFLGIDLDRAIRDERLILVRYQLDFVRRLGRATSPEVAFAELRRILGDKRVDRIAIDSIVPFLDATPTGSNTIYLLIQFLDELKATSLLTFPGDMTGVYDRRLEPLMQRCAGVFHLSSDAERNHRLEIRKIRHEAPSTRPVTFRILSGAGMVVMDDSGAAMHRESAELSRQILLLNMADPVPQETLSAMQHHYELDVRSGMFSAFSELVSRETGALLLNVRRDVIESALQLIRDLRKTNNSVPVVLLTPYILRSADRTRALRAGADDFLSSSLAPTELVARMETIVQRGHWHELASPSSEPPLVLQPTADESTYTVMSEESLRKTLQGYLNRDRVPFFTLFMIDATVAQAPALAAMILELVRVESGDLVGMIDGKVCVYLDSARPKDLASLKIRMREQALRHGLGELDIESFGFPAQENVVRSVVGLPAAR